MKTSHKFLLVLGLAGTAACLASCAKTVTNACFAMDNGNEYCTYILKVTGSVNNGYFTGATVDAIASVSTWARISDEKAAELTAEGEGRGEGYDFVTVKNVTDYNGDTLSQVHYAKHISYAGMNWTAHARTEDETTSWHGEEYVCYCLDSTALNGTALTYDMVTYLDSSSSVDTGRYKLGSLYQTYYEAVEQGNIHILKEKSRTENTSLTNLYEYTYETEDLAPITFVGGNKYRCNWDADWKAATEIVCDVTVNTLKRLNFTARFTDSAGKKHNSYKLVEVTKEDGSKAKYWEYNPTFIEDQEASYYDKEDGWVVFTGVTAAVMPDMDFRYVMISLNWAYAAGEYSSIR